MTNDVYVFLTKPKKTKARIACIDERLADLRQMMLPSGIRYDTDKVQSSPEDPMLRYIERSSELEEERKQLLLQYQHEQEDIVKAIDTIDDVYVQQVMTMRYVSGKGWDDIIDHMPFVDRTIYRFHKSGLQDMARYLKYVSECQ